MPKPLKKTAPKRPKDVNEWAHQLVRLSTERDDDAEKAPAVLVELSLYMAEIGRKGGKIGGKRRLRTMTSAERSRVAAKAAKARWAKRKRTAK